MMCVLLACYMTTKETLRFLKNEDTSSIRYKYFANSPEDTYPTFSFCLTDEQLTSREGLIYSYFKEDIYQTLPYWDADFSTFAQILQGKKLSSGIKDEAGLDIRNLSDNYANSFTIELTRLYQMVEFKTKNSNDSLEFSADSSTQTELPFYISYQDPERICYTRNSDSKEGIIRIEDILSLIREQLQMFDEYVTFKIYVHHPGQLLRKIDNPVFQSTLKDFEWEKSVLIFKIYQVSILRKRPSGNTPCDIELYDDDNRLLQKISEKVGCIPIYWKNILYLSFHLEVCKTPDDLKKVHAELNQFSHILSTYLPPCNEMKSTVTLERQRIMFGQSYMIIKLKYLDNNYEEIVNEREFGFESFWSTVGGFIGIFIGTSLMQLPSLIATACVWLHNLRK